MTLQQAIDEALRNYVAPIAKEYEYRKTRRVWRKSTGNGDCAAFNVQSSMWDSADAVDFWINLGSAPEPWLDCQGWKGRNFAPQRGMFQNHLTPGTALQSHDSYRVRSLTDVEPVMIDIEVQLRESALPELEAILDRATLQQCLRDRRMGFVKGDNAASTCDYWLTVVLADDGPSDELDVLLTRHSRDKQVDTDLVTWCRGRLAARS